MAYTHWKLERYPILSTGLWSTSADVLTDFYDPIIHVNTGDSRDSFSFKVTNTSGAFDNYFKPQDKIVISRVISTTTTSSSDVVMVGSIQSTPQDESANQNLIRVEGFNFTEAILSGITFVDATTLDVAEALEAAVNSVSLYNNNFAVTWKASNPSVTTSGSAFPTVGEQWFNKPLRQLFEKWSVKENTGDINYFWYVNNANELVWAPSTDTVSASFNAATDAYQSIKISKDSSDVKNWIIVKGGLDPNNDPIQERVDDLASINKHGMRYYILPDHNKTAGTYIDKDKSTEGVTDLSSASYPFTTSWGQSVSSYNDYVSKLRVQVKSELRRIGEAFLNNRKYGKLKVDITFEPGKGWSLGELISCTIPQLTSTGSTTPIKKLRVVGIQYSTTSDTFTLEEDEGSI